MVALFSSGIINVYFSFQGINLILILTFEFFSFLSLLFQVKKCPASVVSVILRIFNIANAVLLGFTAYYAYGITNGSITLVFLATYIAIFAVLLLLFETRVKYTEAYIRRYVFLIPFSEHAFV